MRCRKKHSLPLAPGECDKCEGEHKARLNALLKRARRLRKKTAK